MRKIYPRSDCPEALLRFQKTCQPVRSEHWDQLRAQEPALYIEIRETLAYDQNGFCIYCERTLDPQDTDRQRRGHIEHFKPKGDYSADTLNWNNLMHSCHHQTSCGHFKKRRYFDGFLNPYQDPIEEWLEFSLTTGEVAPSAQAPPERREDIIKSLSLLGLNEPGLQRKRKSLLRSLQAQVLACENTPEALTAFFKNLEHINLPFVTARRQAQQQLG